MPFFLHGFDAARSGAVCSQPREIAGRTTTLRRLRPHGEGPPARHPRLDAPAHQQGALEGMNNKVKVIAHRAYGFRKAETYITAVYHCCADLPL